MFVQTEITPNPLTLKFIPGRIVMDDGTLFFKNIEEAKDSPFAKKLFNIEGIEGVFFGSDFITITKKQEVNWDTLKPLVLGVISDFYSSNEKIIKKSESNQNQKKELSKDTDIVKKIKELIETRVRPAVAMDGGDIIFEKFESGIVYLHMQGSCAGCPSSTATLKSGIENMLKHYVPEVSEVKPVVE
tara:strand:+ start:1237 stop:1797 length:561 start_codon:yes stop_codon:yes gene_type:complete